MAGTGLRRVESWRALYAVRRDWPDGGHEFVGMNTSTVDAERFLSRDRRYWRLGPMRPTYAVVEISVRDFELHRVRRECRSPDCPSPLATRRSEGARS